jgi:hypothetical protein
MPVEPPLSATLSRIVVRLPRGSRRYSHADAVGDDAAVAGENAAVAVAGGATRHLAVDADVDAAPDTPVCRSACSR